MRATKDAFPFSFWRSAAPPTRRKKLAGGSFRSRRTKRGVMWRLSEADFADAAGRTRLRARMRQAAHRVLVKGWNCGAAGSILVPAATRQSVFQACGRVLVKHHQIRKEKRTGVPVSR